jgi:GTP-binding protein Era
VIFVQALSPLSGKSTLLNRIVGEKIAIISPKPQTTWNRIVGVKTLPNAQIIFVDTPGVHEASSKLNRTMVNTARKALHDANVALHMVEATSPLLLQCEQIVWQLLGCREVPVILLINKIDLVKTGDFLAGNLAAFHYTKVICISALLGTGVDLLEKEVVSLLPPGPKYYPDEVFTDQTERFMVGEIIREQIFHLTHKEIPYSCAVVVEDFKEREGGAIFIRASINVEKESQKGIIIGKEGKKLKEIGRLARIDIEQFLGAKIYLDLWVKVLKNWRRKESAIREFGLA